MGRNFRTVYGILLPPLGAIHKLRHKNFMIVWPLLRPCHRLSHFWDPSPYLVWRHIFCRLTKFPLMYEMARTLNVITCILVKLLNAFQWNCFNLLDTCNIALIQFLKCDVTKFRISPFPCHTMSHFIDPLTCHVIYGCPLIIGRQTWLNFVFFSAHGWTGGCMGSVLTRSQVKLCSC